MDSQVAFKRVTMGVVLFLEIFYWAKINTDNSNARKQVEEINKLIGQTKGTN